MAASKWLRQFHRWASVAFVGVAAAIFVALGVGVSPAAWVFFLPLAPLAGLTLTGLYLFCAPWLGRRRHRHRVAA